MLTKQVVSFADVMIEKEICKGEDREILIYGLTTGLQWLLNIATTIVLGLLFGMVIKSLIFLVSFSFLRTYAGG